MAAPPDVVPEAASYAIPTSSELGASSAAAEGEAPPEPTRKNLGDAVGMVTLMQSMARALATTEEARPGEGAPAAASAEAAAADAATEATAEARDGASKQDAAADATTAAAGSLDA